MIEKGLTAEEMKSLNQRNVLRTDPLTALKWGMVLVGVGIAIMLGIWLRDNYLFNDGVIPGLIAAFGGIGLVLFYFMANKKTNQ